jgi:hypothetical protein
MAENERDEPLLYNEQICKAFGVSRENLAPLTPAPGAKETDPDDPPCICGTVFSISGPCLAKVHHAFKSTAETEAAIAKSPAYQDRHCCLICGKPGNDHAFRSSLSGDVIRCGIRGVLVCPSAAELDEKAHSPISPRTAERPRNCADPLGGLSDLESAVMHAVRELPDGFRIMLHTERGAGWATLSYPGTPFEYQPGDFGMTLSMQILDCVEKAKYTPVVGGEELPE